LAGSGLADCYTEAFGAAFFADDQAIIVCYFAQEPDGLFFAADKIDDLASPGHFETCPDVFGRPSGVAAVVSKMIFHCRLIKISHRHSGHPIVHPFLLIFW